MKKLIVAINSFNRLKSTTKCLENLYNTSKIPFDLILFDNNSIKSVQDELREQSKIYDFNLILARKNYFAHFARYIMGLFARDYEYILFLDNDVYLQRNCIENLFNEINNADVVSASLMLKDNTIASINQGYFNFSKSPFGDFVNLEIIESKNSKDRYVDFCTTSAILMKTLFFKKIDSISNWIDRTKKFGNMMEDIDLSLWIHKINGQIKISDGLAYHYPLEEEKELSNIYQSNRFNRDWIITGACNLYKDWKLNVLRNWDYEENIFGFRVNEKLIANFFKYQMDYFKRNCRFDTNFNQNSL